MVIQCDNQSCIKLTEKSVSLREETKYWVQMAIHCVSTVNEIRRLLCLSSRFFDLASILKTSQGETR